MLARRVVLATGRDGLGGAYVPAFAHKIPRARWAHSSDVMDYAMLADKRVGVVGAARPPWTARPPRWKPAPPASTC